MWICKQCILVPHLFPCSSDQSMQSQPGPYSMCPGCSDKQRAGLIAASNLGLEIHLPSPQRAPHHESQTYILRHRHKEPHTDLSGIQPMSEAVCVLGGVSLFGVGGQAWPLSGMPGRHYEQMDMSGASLGHQVRSTSTSHLLTGQSGCATLDSALFSAHCSYVWLAFGYLGKTEELLDISLCSEQGPLRKPPMWQGGYSSPHTAYAIPTPDWRSPCIA